LAQINITVETYNFSPQQTPYILLHLFLAINPAIINILRVLYSSFLITKNPCSTCRRILTDSEDLGSVERMGPMGQMGRMGLMGHYRY